MVGKLNSLDDTTIVDDFNAKKFITENVYEPLTKLVEMAYNLGREMKPKRNHGHWIDCTAKRTGLTLAYMYPHCSVCGMYSDYTNFCPHCGADMRADVNERRKWTDDRC